jgi:FtsX-like permease family protein
LLGGFALMALLLATVGLYGTVACDVGQRTREFGLRMSLGAQPSSVMGMVFRQGSQLLLLGIEQNRDACALAIERAGRELNDEGDVPGRDVRGDRSQQKSSDARSPQGSWHGADF